MGAHPIVRHRLRTTVGIIAATVVVAGCAFNRPLPPLVGGGDGPGRPCSVAAVRSCALPYPSDQFTVPDPFSGTGRAVVVPDEILPERIVAQFGPGVSPEATFADADGFSAITPVIFELDGPVARSTLPRDGGDAFAVFDAESGARVRIRAEVPTEAGRHGAPDTVVVAWPRDRFEYGRTYVARLSTALRPRDGGAFTKPAALESTDDATLASARADLARIEGNRWDEVVSATRFTVRSSGNATAQLDGMAAIARAEDHPVRDLAIGPPFLVDHASAVVTGQVRLSDFRDGDGVARVANGSTGRWAKFLLALPEEPAGTAGAPVVIYGHGLTVAKETMASMASSNAEQGLATIGIDVPNHGDRQAGFDGGYLLDLTTPRRFGRLASMPLQGIVDHVSLLMAVQQHLGDLDLRLPDTLERRGGDPAPQLDTSRILYQGTSMGGVLGGSFAALAPELDGAFLQVAGSGIADIIYHSLLWPLFMSLIPEGASTGDAYAVMGAATMLLDPSDNVNVLQRTRGDDTPVFLAYGVGDGIVPNFASDRLIGQLDLPLVGPRLTNIDSDPPSTGSASPPQDGWGVAQIWSSAPMEVQSFGAHIAFAEPRSERLMQEWVAGRLAATGVSARR